MITFSISSLFLFTILLYHTLFHIASVFNNFFSKFLVNFFFISFLFLYNYIISHYAFKCNRKSQKFLKKVFQKILTIASEIWYNKRGSIFFFFIFLLLVNVNYMLTEVPPGTQLQLLLLTRSKRGVWGGLAAQLQLPSSLGVRLGGGVLPMVTLVPPPTTQKSPNICSGYKQ